MNYFQESCRKSKSFMCKTHLVFFSITLSLVFGTNLINAQENHEPKKPVFYFNNGIGIIAPDSIFSLNFRFRIQTRAGYTTVSETDFSATAIEARVRRLRMRFEGFIINPKFNYYIQLSFSRGDMDWNVRDNSSVNTSPNIVRDAVVIYKPNQNLSFLFGQTKLPGNRQRVVSSGELQFADRSISNAAFNIDRDFGFQAIYQNNISNFIYVIKAAVSSGEGRNSVISGAGLAYTGRLEILPFGKFTNKGDYFEGDIEREQTPKLSLAAGYHYNENAMRTAGTLGSDLYNSRDLHSFIADILLKYRGLALAAEYLNRNTISPVTQNAQLQERTVYVGQGGMLQLSYNFKSNFEIAGRYSIVTPYKSIEDKEPQKEEMGLGVTKYLRRHRVKLQAHIFYQREKELDTMQFAGKNWAGMFQIELGL